MQLFLITSIGLTAYDFDKSNSAGCAVSEGENSIAQNTSTASILSTGLFTTNVKSANQGYYYSVRGSQDNAITQEQLRNAERVEDIISTYPSTWIDEFDSMELITFKNGEKKRSISSSEVFNKEQKELLNSIAIGDAYVLDVKFKSTNAVTKELEDREINLSMSVVPEVKAKYIGGYEKMIGYLEANTNDELTANGFNSTDVSTIQFTVNEKGEIKDVSMFRSSGDKEVDKILMTAVSSMPNWRSAEDAEGKKVSQQFFFNIGMDGC